METANTKRESGPPKLHIFSENPISPERMNACLKKETHSISPLQKHREFKKQVYSSKKLLSVQSNTDDVPEKNSILKNDYKEAPFRPILITYVKDEKKNYLSKKQMNVLKEAMSQQLVKDSFNSSTRLLSVNLRSSSPFLDEKFIKPSVNYQINASLDEKFAEPLLDDQKSPFSIEKHIYSPTDNDANPIDENFLKPTADENIIPLLVDKALKPPNMDQMNSFFDGKKLKDSRSSDELINPFNAHNFPSNINEIHAVCNNATEIKSSFSPNPSYLNKNLKKIPINPNLHENDYAMTNDPNLSKISFEADSDLATPMKPVTDFNSDYCREPRNSTLLNDPNETNTTKSWIEKPKMDAGKENFKSFKHIPKKDSDDDKIDIDKPFRPIHWIFINDSDDHPTEDNTVEEKSDSIYHRAGNSNQPVISPSWQTPIRRAIDFYQKPLFSDYNEFKKPKIEIGEPNINVIQENLPNSKSYIVDTEEPFKPIRLTFNKKSKFDYSTENNDTSKSQSELKCHTGSFKAENIFPAKDKEFQTTEIKTFSLNSLSLESKTLFKKCENCSVVLKKFSMEELLQTKQICTKKISKRGRPKKSVIEKRQYKNPKNACRRKRKETRHQTLISYGLLKQEVNISDQDAKYWEFRSQKTNSYQASTSYEPQRQTNNSLNTNYGLYTQVNDDPSPTFHDSYTQISNDNSSTSYHPYTQISNGQNSTSISSYAQLGANLGQEQTSYGPHMKISSDESSASYAQANQIFPFDSQFSSNYEVSASYKPHMEETSGCDVSASNGFKNERLPIISSVMSNREYISPLLEQKRNRFPNDSDTSCTNDSQQFLNVNVKRETQDPSLESSREIWSDLTIVRNASDIGIGDPLKNFFSSMYGYTNTLPGEKQIPVLEKIFQSVMEARESTF